MKILVLASLVGSALAAPSQFSVLSALTAVVQSFKGSFASFPNALVETYSEPFSTVLDRNEYVVRSGSELLLNGERWYGGGANVYWLGLDENVIPPAGQPFYAPYKASYPNFERITEIMNTLNVMGVRIIRSQTLGISVGNPLSLEPELNVWNDEAFNTIDWAVYQARQHGLRIVAPLIDNYDYYHGGKYVFLRWRGFNLTYPESSGNAEIMQFYTNRTIIDDFKNYIHHLLTHVNPYTGLSYAEDPTIFAYETGNELSGTEWGDMDVPNSWTQEIADYIKQLGPHKLVMDGTYGINETHLQLANVDLYSDHFYPLNLDQLNKDISLVGSANKVYFAGEYDWTGTDASAPSLESFYEVIESQLNQAKPVIAGDAFWSLFMHNPPNCVQYVNHSDGYTLQYGNPDNTNLANTQIDTMRNHFFKVKNQSPGDVVPRPIAPCPGPLADLTYF